MQNDVAPGEYADRHSSFRRHGDYCSCPPILAPDAVEPMIYVPGVPVPDPQMVRHDNNGTLTYDGSFAYGYDAENRLTGITQGGTGVASYAYDAQGRRKAKTVGSAATVFVTDADNREILEYDGTSGAVKSWYAYGLGSNEVLNYRFAIDVWPEMTQKR